MLRRTIKVSLILGVFIFSILVLPGNCFADSKYNNNKTKCLKDAGTLKNIESVDWACGKAADGNQNGCALWIGNAASATVPKIYVKSLTGTATVMYWGTCTDLTDKPSNIFVENDNNSIGDDGVNLPWGIQSTYAFTRPVMKRSATTPVAVSGRGTTLNIANFVSGGGVTKTETECGTEYTRKVTVWRSHGTDPKSRSSMDQDITVVVTDKPGCGEDPDTCAILGGTFKEGVTNISLGVKNTDLYMRSGGSEDWKVSTAAKPATVYAKPGDRIAWHTCYYPGMQASSVLNAEVSEVIGKPNFNTPLPTNECLASPMPLVKKKLKDIFGAAWQNKFSLSNPIGSQGSRSSEGTTDDNRNADPYKEFLYDIGDTTIRWAHNESNILSGKEGAGDVGSTYTETATTGTPTKLTMPVTPTLSTSEEVYSKSKDGACHDGANQIEIDSRLQIFCPAIGVTFNSSTYPDTLLYPDRLGWWAGNAAVSPAIPAQYCWTKKTGGDKYCGECQGDANCLSNCKTCNGKDTCVADCNGNADCIKGCCTCKEIESDGKKNYECLQCTNKYDGDFVAAKVDETPAVKNASVIVPYNFEIHTGVELDTSKTLFSGEVLNIKEIWTQVEPRYNDATKDYYATKVPSGAKINLAAYVTKDSDGGFSEGEIGSANDLCSTLNTVITDANAKWKQCSNIDTRTIDDELNKDNDQGGGDRDRPFGNTTYAAFDASAGDYICVVSAVWPSASKDTETSTDLNVTGNGKWRYSTPSCQQINKRPSLQVWGGSIYSAGNINSNPPAKNNVYGEWNYTKNTNNKHFFGTWAEHSLIIGSGTSNTIASGAATNGSQGATKALCENRAPLSFANDDGTCTTSKNTVGKSGIGAGSEGASRDELIRYWGYASPNYTDGTIDLVDSGLGTPIKNQVGVNMRYINKSGNVNISGKLSESMTYLIESSGTVTITDSVLHPSGTNNSLDKVSKIIIYANKINIQCHVKEVDAVLITKVGGVVNTCSDEASVASKKRSTQLKIFGTVITDEFVPHRTYGSAAGDKSTEPAEIIDYDSSLLMWAENLSQSAQTTTLQTAYQRELAPRY
ncbi:hypothetical protein J6S55_02200 [Candidatus Saccharibacteria bacterium]|nr:hypothetical protein [Candidatus Saccharibacteria bacterium]